MSPADRFKAACRKWRARFGLTDWRLVYKTAADDGEHAGYVSYNWDSRHAVITMVRDIHGEGRPEATALHEMLHVLLADLLATAAMRSSDTHPDVAREEHRVIERLMTVLGGDK